LKVLITEDEVSGEITRQWLKDTDNIALYKQMRETLVFLTHLDYDDTQNIMIEKLNEQADGIHFNWLSIQTIHFICQHFFVHCEFVCHFCFFLLSRGDLNTLCWAIGAIAGAQCTISFLFIPGVNISFDIIHQNPFSNHLSGLIDFLALILNCFLRSGRNGKEIFGDSHQDTFGTL
jgi:hypothetical protein